MSIYTKRSRYDLHSTEHVLIYHSNSRHTIKTLVFPQENKNFIKIDYSACIRHDCYLMRIFKYQNKNSSFVPCAPIDFISSTNSKGNNVNFLTRYYTTLEDGFNPITGPKSKKSRANL